LSERRTGLLAPPMNPSSPAAVLLRPQPNEQVFAKMKPCCARPTREASMTPGGASARSSTASPPKAPTTSKTPDTLQP